MKKNDFYTFIAASLAMLVPVPGRFACGIVLVLGIYFFTILGTLFRKVIQKLALDDLQPVLIAIILVSTAVLYKLLLVLFSPVLALLLGFSIYLSAISSFMIGNLYDKSFAPLGTEFKLNMTKCSQFAAYSLLFFLFRDIFGYGTITFPARTGMHVLKLYGQMQSTSPSIFWASIPGALILTALLLVLFSYVSRMFEMVEEKKTTEVKETEGEKK